MSLLPDSTRGWLSSPRRDPDTTFSRFQREMNRMMDDFMLRPRSLVGDGESAFYPAVDIVDEDKKYLLKVDLPGLTEKDIQLDLHDNILTIKGEKREESSKTTGPVVCSERYYGSFRRDIPFDDAISEEKVEAKLKDGVLTVELEKSATVDTHHKKIAIRH